MSRAVVAVLALFVVGCASMPAVSQYSPQMPDYSGWVQIAITQCYSYDDRDRVRNTIISSGRWQLDSSPAEIYTVSVFEFKDSGMRIGLYGEGELSQSSVRWISKKIFEFKDDRWMFVIDISGGSDLDRRAADFLDVKYGLTCD